MPADPKRHIREIRGSVFNTVVQSEDSEFDSAIGDFVSRFSLIEVTFILVLAKVANIDRTVLKAIVYPLRIDNGINMTKRAITARKLKGKGIEELLKTLDHLAKINKFRNDLLHLGAMPHGDVGDYLVSNKAIAFDRSVQRKTTVNLTTLRRLRHDLMVITAIWIDFIGRLPKSGGKELRPDPEYYQSSKAYRQAHPLGSAIPWLYKPQQPKGRKGKTLRKRQAPKPPRQSS